MKYLFSFLFILISLSAYSNAPIQIDNTSGIYDLDRFIYYFTDSSGKLTFDDIRNNENSGKFQLLDTSYVKGGTAAAYWFRISLTTSENQNNWWLLLKDPSFINDGIQSVYTAANEYVDGYIVNPDGTVQHKQEGVFTPENKRENYVNPMANIFSISLTKNDTVTMFIRVYNSNRDDLHILFELRNPVSGFPTDKISFNIFLAFLMGVMGMLGLLCIFLFFANRDYANLFFGCICLMLMFEYTILHNEGLFIRWFVPQKPWLSAYYWTFFTIGLQIFLPLFGRSFVDLLHKSRFLDHVMKGISIGAAVVLVFELLNHAFTWRLNISLPILGLSFLLIIAIAIRIGFYQGYASKVFMLGALCLVFFCILGLIYNAGKFTLFNPWPVGQVGLILIYAFGLAYKMKETERIKAGQERKLEDARKIEAAYAELKSTQAQLIQSEKMASLGELTAGIAHEIQNPLNFVNNFSEVSNELLDEMNEELDKGELDEAKVIAADVKLNLEKINYHGKRADAIVKGMLQHSRGSSGQKELTDLNTLCDEYLRLSYHGLRAKDKSFNATFETDFDASLPKINVIPQDIGRVILNLINNAFYTVNEKKKTADDNYKPTVKVSTMQENGYIQIAVADNGNGIPEKVREKIFQPFFTTKPTGAGTGLGLSLSYDIVKAHGGKLRLETQVGVGTKFFIELPVGR